MKKWVPVPIIRRPVQLTFFMLISGGLASHADQLQQVALVLDIAGHNNKYKNIDLYQNWYTKWWPKSSKRIHSTKSKKKQHMLKSDKILKNEKKV